MAESDDLFATLALVPVEFSVKDTWKCPRRWVVFLGVFLVDCIFSMKEINFIMSPNR